jgi:MoaA/NifB/PqqE/SkfB family radical SAM enzyme
MISDEEWTEHAKPLQFLDLKLGNICNLKCRICGSWSSSTYAAEEIKHQSDKKNNFHYVMMKLGRWPREQQRFWDDLEQHMSGIRYLEFTGGEPFMIQEHFDLLRKLVTAGHAGDIEIHYNTNGTIFPAGAEDLWRHFRHVEIAFSIDDVAERFEYQRSGAGWLEVNANLDLFRDMRARNANMTLQVCTTVNVFNVMYLDDIAHWIDQQSFDFVYWNMLHDGPQFCIANLSASAKQLVEQRLTHATFSHAHAKEIQRIIHFMWQGSQDLSQQLCDSIRQVDQRRDQDIRRIAPDFAQAIGYEA